MDFKGFSGSTFKIVSRGVLRKYAVAGQEERLRKQAEKQRSFYGNKWFSVPKILEIGTNYFDMELVHGLNIIEFLNRAGKKELDRLFECIQGFILDNYDSDYSDILPQIKEKCKQLNQPIHIPYIRIPLFNGKCHGDLTLGNIIYGDKFYLVDFLDSYIDSPSMDFVKLRQSTHLKWELFLYNNTRNTRAKMALDYLDKKIFDSPFYIPFYRFLQEVNLYRVLPYTKSDADRNFIKGCISLL